jgi:hypothetical protein
MEDVADQLSAEVRRLLGENKKLQVQVDKWYAAADNNDSKARCLEDQVWDLEKEVKRLTSLVQQLLGE